MISKRRFSQRVLLVLVEPRLVAKPDTFAKRSSTEKEIMGDESVRLCPRSEKVRCPFRIKPGKISFLR